MILASLKRITGKSLGEIPMNPDMSSSTQQIEVLREQYRKLVGAWSEFLASDEGKQLLRTLRQAEENPQGSDKSQVGPRGPSPAVSRSGH
jgi:hypothetical protein